MPLKLLGYSIARMDAQHMADMLGEPAYVVFEGGRWRAVDILPGQAIPPNAEVVRPRVVKRSHWPFAIGCAAATWFIAALLEVPTVALIVLVPWTALVSFVSQEMGARMEKDRG